MRNLVEAGDGGREHEVLRLRKMIRFANLLASLRMTGLWGMSLVYRMTVLAGAAAICLALCLSASASTYYVSSSSGSDANNGTSSSTPWQTIAHVNGLTFLPGDSILFKRGDIWNESLTPPSSGSSGNPIAFDAYGTGLAPNFTGYYAMPTTGWVAVTGNAWKAPVPSTFTTVNFCLFGSVWGQKVGALSSNLTAQWDFYLANGFLYVFSVGNPANYYNEPIVPMALSNVPVININGKSWLTFQHLLLNWFDQYGVYVQGTSDHLVFANMEMDSMIPQGTQPLGLYVNETGSGPGDIKIYNAEAHLNYDGFRFDGSATAIAMVNDKAYANRDGALVDNTSAVTYSYCHFYASSLAVAGSTDVTWTSGTGPTAGAGNVAVDVPPAVQVYQRYPARVTLTVDDSGMTVGADSYYATTVLPIADAAGVPVGAAITVGYALAQTLISEFQGWINAGRDVTSHSISHTYYTNTDALDIQYTGSGTAAALSISGKVLTITVTGASDSVSYNLAQGQTQGTIEGVRQALIATGKFTATEITPCQGPYGTGCSAYTESALLAQDLADVSGQDVRSSVYHVQLDVTRLTTDELTLSRQWMTTNLTGLAATPVYVYPGGYETTTMQGIAAGVPYTGARGALKEDLGVKDTYASGFNVQNVTSFGVNPSWQGLTAANLQQKVQALVWKEMVWGVPWGIFWHLNELSGTEVANLIADLQASGATVQTNTALVNTLMGGTLEMGTDGNTYYKLPALNTFSSNGALNFGPTASSPVVDAGQNLGTAYQLDINGVNQNSNGSGWEIGAHAYVGFSTYGQGASGYSSIGVGNTGLAQLPLNWVHESESTAPNGVYDVTRTATTFANLQQAICDWVAAPDQWWLVQVPHGTVIDTTSTGYTCTQTGSILMKSLTLITKIVSGAAPTKFIVFDSDTPLLYGQTVCAHGITDTAATRQPPSGAISSWWTGGNNGCANDIGSMWTLEGNWTAGNIGLTIQSGAWDATTNIGPSHYAFRDVEIRPATSNNNPVFVVNMDENPTGTTPPTMTSQMASRIHFMNVYGHGDATDWNGTSGGPGNNRISDFVKMEGCQYCSVTYSYFDYITSSGAEGHVIGAIANPGPLKIAHNWLSGASSTQLLGGASGQESLYFDRDVEVRENRMTNPPTWVGSGYGGASLVIKNRQEWKACQRCLLDGNIAEYVDLSGAQNGQCFTLTPRNCSGGAVCDNYQAVLQDVTVTNNICRHALTGIQTASRSNYPGGNGGGATAPLRRVSVSNNLFYDLGNGPLYDAATVVANPYVIRPTGAGESFICAGSTVSGALKLLTCSGTTGLMETQISVGDMFSVTNCADATWNVPNGNFGVTRGATALTGTNPNGLTIYYNASAAVSSTTTGCIVGNTLGGQYNFNFIHNTAVMQTTGGGRNNGRIFAGVASQLYTDTGCTGAGATNATTITAISRDSTGTMVTATVASTTGWAANLTSSTQTLVEVTGESDFNGTFYYIGQSGSNLQWQQTGTANETGASGGTSQQMGTCPASIFDQSNVWKDNLVAVDVGTAPSCPGTPSAGWTGWVDQGGSNLEGCASGVANASCSENLVDSTNSLVTYTDLPGRCGAKYMEVGGTNANAIPPVTLTFPASTVCAGSTADATCVGMNGMMSGSAFDTSDSDYHQYGLVASSQYKAGNANQADDLTDLGADLGALDNALTRATYVCGSWCGLGPKSDAPKIQILAPGAGVTIAAVNTYLKPSPYVGGIVYTLWWSCSDQDGTAAHYSWTSFDSQVISDGWAAAGKKISVVLGGVTYGGSDNVCYGSGWGTTGLGNYATPAYVWTGLGAANYTTCTSSGQTQRIPNYLNAAYSSNYQNWVAAALRHLAGSAYASSIGYVRVAWGKGGETTPIASWNQAGMCPDGGGNNTLTTDWGYTLSGWENFLQQGMTFEAALKVKLQLMISITPMGPDAGSQGRVPDFIAPIAAVLHIGFGTQGLASADLNNCAGSAGDWCSLFHAYQGKVPLETQTLFNSCAASNMSGSCSSLATQTGPLDPLLTWAAQNHGTSFEMYYQDACAMLCPGYSVAGYASYSQAGYLAALANVVGGNY